MGQTEVYEWLIKQRLNGIDQYYTIKDVITALGAEGNECHEVNVSRSIRILYMFGYLDIHREGIRKQYFRIKKKHCHNYKRVACNTTELKDVTMS